MVQHIEELRAELQSKPLGYYEVLKRAEIKVPVRRTSEGVAAQITVLTWRWYAELAAIGGRNAVGAWVEPARLEHYRAEDIRHVEQACLRRGSDEVGP